MFEDEWTDTAVAPKADAFALSYGDLRTPAPMSAVCASHWTSNCRVVIHYEQHVHPLWNLTRQVLDTDGVTVVADYTCTGCHNHVDDQGQTQVPVAQLDLSDGPSPDQPLHFNAYRELLFPTTNRNWSMVPWWTVWWTPERS